MSENVFLGFPNRVDRGNVSGGNWVPSLPADNLQSRLIAKIARSQDTTEESTQFVIDFLSETKIRIIALVAHNLSFGARVAITASNTDDFSELVFTRTFDAWGSQVSAGWKLDELEWEDDNFWLGTYSFDEIDGLTATASFALPMEVAARYWRIAILDTSNTDGFVDIGRVFMGPGWQPKVNYSYGGSLAYEDLTSVEVSLSGAEFFDVREPFRVFRFSLERLSNDEGFGSALETMRRAGVHGEIFVIPDIDDSFHALRRNFMGRLRALSPLEQSIFAHTSTSFEIKELR